LGILICDEGGLLGWDSLPDADRYSRAVSRPVEQNPLLAILAAGAVGYLLAYLIRASGFQGSGWQWNRESVPGQNERLQPSPPRLTGWDLSSACAAASL
jgi:hypothetical protein